MDSVEKEIQYNTTNTYSTLNNINSYTKTVWFVCHGMGYLSRYFIRHFSGLNEGENYIIAPQAQSKYYLPPKGKHVGASWLTRENTKKETENVMRSFDAIFEKENLPPNINFNVLGYSQGVSVAMRYLARRKINCNKLILVSGGIPIELQKTDFEYLDSTTLISFIYGTKDEYLNEKRIETEKNKLLELFNGRANIYSFDGGHDFDLDTVMSLIK